MALPKRRPSFVTFAFSLCLVVPHPFDYESRFCEGLQPACEERHDIDAVKAASYRNSHFVRFAAKAGRRQNLT